MERPPSDGGFALLDALVAIAIFAVMTGMFVQVVHSSAITRRRAAETRDALLVAQSRLALVAETRGPESSGREGQFHWRAQVSRYPGVENSRGLEQVTVSVTNRATGRTVTRLKTLRIAR